MNTLTPEQHQELLARHQDKGSWIFHNGQEEITWWNIVDALYEICFDRKDVIQIEVCSSFGHIWYTRDGKNFEYHNIDTEDEPDHWWIIINNEPEPYGLVFNTQQP